MEISQKGRDRVASCEFVVWLRNVLNVMTPLGVRGEKMKSAMVMLELMNRTELLKKLDATLEEWARTRQWGVVKIEIHDGEPYLLRKETKGKFIGGCSHAPKRETR